MSVETLKPNVPDHVPAELVWDHSLAQFTHELDDPYVAASRLHDGPDIIWATDAALGKPGWVVTSLATMQEVFLDYEHFSGERAAFAPMLGVDWKLNPLEFDPPEHHKYRNILNPLFTPKAVKGLDEAVKEICESLISSFEDKGGCEFVEDFALPFPSYVFLALMGMPKEMLPQFLEWENQLLRGSEIAVRVAGARGILHYLQGFVAEQRKNPSTELLQTIFNGVVDGRPLNDGEALGMIYLFYIGGLDTVYSTIGWVMRHLANHPELQERLRNNPDDIPAAVDEFTRAFGVASPHRTVTEDFEFHGIKMRKGEEIHMPSYIASRDPRAYDNPHVIDIDRKSRHISFGYGTHNCLGLHLAKREIRTVIHAFLSRFKNIHIPEGESYEYHTGSVIGVDRLPLKWERI